MPETENAAGASGGAREKAYRSGLEHSPKPARPQPVLGTCFNCAWARPVESDEDVLVHRALTRLCTRVPTFAAELPDFPVHSWFSCHGWRRAKR
jgi:hypothetical protein